MENWKKFLNEAKEETASVEEIEEVIFDVLKKEGGAAGLQPIEDALKELDKDLPEGFDLKAHIEEMPEEKIKFHDEGDVIEMGGLKEGEGGVPKTKKQKEFAALAPPENEITYADKIAGATADQTDQKKK